MIIYFQLIIEGNMIPHRGKRTHTHEGEFLEQLSDNIENN